MSWLIWHRVRHKTLTWFNHAAIILVLCNGLGQTIESSVAIFLGMGEANLCGNDQSIFLFRFF